MRHRGRGARSDRGHRLRCDHQRHQDAGDGRPRAPRPNLRAPAGYADPADHGARAARPGRASPARRRLRFHPEADRPRVLRRVVEPSGASQAVAAPRQGARPAQDAVLHQRQPRASHAAHVGAGADPEAPGRGSPHRRSASRRGGDRSQRPDAAQARQRPARHRQGRCRPDAAQLRRGGPGVARPPRRRTLRVGRRRATNRPLGRDGAERSGPGRPREAAACLPEPPLQRLQVRFGRRPRTVRAARGGGSRTHHRRGQRSRRAPRASGSDLRALSTGRCRVRSARRRHGPGAGDRQGVRRTASRDHRPRRRSGRRGELQRGPAARRPVGHHGGGGDAGTGRRLGRCVPGGGSTAPEPLRGPAAGPGSARRAGAHRWSPSSGVGDAAGAWTAPGAGRRGQRGDEPVHRRDVGPRLSNRHRLRWPAGP